VQRWFFELGLAEPRHFDQSVVLDLPPGASPASIGRALRDLVRAHDALRLHVAPGDLRSLHVAADVEPALPVIAAGRGDAAAVDAVAERLRADLDLGRPPLLRAAWLAPEGGGPARLLLILHHLVVDAVSWRILVEELLGDRRPAPTTSFSEWARRLSGFARSKAVERDLDYWLETGRHDVRPMPVDHPFADRGVNTEGSSATVVVALDAGETDALLRGPLAAAGAQVNDVLLAALLHVWRRFTGDDRLLVDLEGHGREEVFDGVDLSRTVGWLTTIFPVLLAVDPGARPSPAVLLPSVREQLRRVPYRGLSYGLLRYLRSDDVAERLRRLPSPEIGFNYLGRLDGDLAGLVPGGAGRNSSPRNRRPHLLDVDAFVGDDGLRVRWTYCANVHRAATVARLADDYRAALRDLVAHAPTPTAAERRPADPRMPDVDAGQLEKLGRLLEGRK
jgi:non-ribosomal peptide synthase protein (TIGR01720 family)